MVEIASGEEHALAMTYNLNMPRVLYTAFDIVPSPKGASTHILHNLRGLVNRNYDTHLLTPSDGILPLEDSIEGAQVTRIPQDLTQNFLARAIHFGKAVLAHLALSSSLPKLHRDDVSGAEGYDVVHYRNIWDGLHIAQNKKRYGYKTLFEVNGLPEAANPKSVRAIVEAIETHPNVVKVVELLTMHLAPKQILINAHINLRDDLMTGDIVNTVEEVEELIKKAEPKVEMIFLETARQCDSSEQDCVPEHVG